MRKVSKKYKRIAEKIINDNEDFKFITELGVKIAYLSSDEEKKSNRKTILAQCIKVNTESYGWCCDYDFMIVVYEPNILDFDNKRLKILIEHELRHVGVDNEGTDPKTYIVPHDIEEFWKVIDNYGLHW